MARIERERTFQPQVFFIRNLGFVTPTEARRISFEETLRFETIHEAVYRRLGYELIEVAAGAVDARLATIVETVANQQKSQGKTAPS
jgi:predicted ATPase